MIPFFVDASKIIPPGWTDAGSDDSTDLIYTCAVGQKHREMSAVLAYSLRRNGYAGKIAVFADGEVIGRDHHPIQSTSNPATLRLEAASIIPGFSSYHRIVYLDCDNLAVKPITGILNSILPGKVFAQPISDANLKWCSGAVAFGGGELAVKFLARWKLEAGEDPNDEPAFNRLARNVLPMPWITHWTQSGNGDAAVIHFSGLRKLAFQKSAMEMASGIHPVPTGIPVYLLPERALGCSGCGQ